MNAPIWQPGTPYAPGAIVRPSIAPDVTSTVLANPDFELGTAGWSGWGPEWTINTLDAFSGVNRALFTGTNNDARLHSLTVAPIKPGITISATAHINPFGAPKRLSQNGGFVVLEFFNAAMVSIGSAFSPQSGIQNAGWYQRTVSSVSPPGTAFVGLHVRAFALQGGSVAFDGITWNVSTIGPPQDLVFKATQAADGTSGPVEPTWPITTGVPVTDNTVTWEGVLVRRVTWKAVPILKTGATEPVWPSVPGVAVRDNTVNWILDPRNITDEKNPRSKEVAISASKIFAADNDIVAFSGTVNPLDWTSRKDAGALPTNLQTGGANPVSGLTLYRGDLVVFTSEWFQLWQVDEDPLNMARIDQMMGIGSTFHKASKPVGNDLFFLTSQGVRLMSIAGGSTNLNADDRGKPIDPLVVEALKTSQDPISLFYPGAGQYWLIMRDADVLDVVNGSNGGSDFACPLLDEEIVHRFHVSGGTPPFTFAVTSGSLPPWAELSADGVFSGTRNTADPFAFTITVTDSVGQTQALEVACDTASFLVTSTLYPAESTDGVDGSVAQVSSELRTILHDAAFADGADGEAAILSMQLRSILLEHTLVEGVDGSQSIQSMELRTLLLNHALLEGVDGSQSIQSMTLDAVLLQTVVGPEGVDGDVSILGMVLQ